MPSSTLPRIVKATIETAMNDAEPPGRPVIAAASARENPDCVSPQAIPVAVPMISRMAPDSAAVSIILFVVLGSVLEGIPAIVLFGPLLFPVARTLGVHEVHYAMVVILAMGIGLFAPPFGVGFYAACAIGRVSPDEAMGRIWPYLGALILALIVVAAFPWLSIGFLER